MAENEEHQSDHHEAEEQQSDFDALIQSVKENPLMYAGAVVFIVACVCSGLFFRLYQTTAAQNEATELARVLDIEDTTERMTELGTLSGNGTLGAEALYLQAELSFEKEDYDAAASSYTQLREQYPDYQFTPDAVEGLGYVQEAKGNSDAAIALYEELRATWPDTYAARRQPFNIARAQEYQGNMKEAIAAYQEQIVVFPNSSIAGRAQHILHKHRDEYPELFEALEGTVDAAVETAEVLNDAIESIEAVEGSTEQ